MQNLFYFRHSFDGEEVKRERLDQVKNKHLFYHVFAHRLSRRYSFFKENSYLTAGLTERVGTAAANLAFSSCSASFRFISNSFAYFSIKIFFNSSARGNARVTMS